MTGLYYVKKEEIPLLDDNELYLTVAGEAVGRVLDCLETVLAANTALEQFHRNRAVELGNRVIE